MLNVLQEILLQFMTYILRIVYFKDCHRSATTFLILPLGEPSQQQNGKQAAGGRKSGERDKDREGERERG